MGPRADGALRPYLGIPPAVIRKRALREPLALQETPDQNGHPAAGRADSYLGYSAMDYQTTKVAIDICEANCGTLHLLDGNVSEGRKARNRSP